MNDMSFNWHYLNITFPNSTNMRFSVGIQCSVKVKEQTAKYFSQYKIKFEKQSSNNLVYFCTKIRFGAFSFLWKLYLKCYFLLLLWICYPTGMFYFLQELCVSEYLISKKGLVSLESLSLINPTSSNIMFCRLDSVVTAYMTYACLSKEN